MVLCAIIISFAVIKYKNSNFDFITYLSGTSTFIVAILTVLYVFTTSKQLDIMSSQLNEMKKDRELQSQPLPWLEKMEISIEKPRFYYTPPSDEYSCRSRYFVISEICNLSDFPAICVDFYAEIYIPDEKSPVYLKATTERIDAISAPNCLGENKKVRFMFCEDGYGKFYESIRSSNTMKLPRLFVKVLYRNVSVGSFCYTNEYIIDSDSNSEQTIKDWHTLIVSFPVKYKDKIDKLKKLRSKNKDKWDKMFHELKSEVACTIQDEFIKLRLVAVSGKFNLKNINQEEYLEITKDNYYGHYIG